MIYKNAKDVLPGCLIKELQRYIQGGYLYIPTSAAQRKQWGEVSGYRQELEKRNRLITEEFRQGACLETLSEKYCLSIHAIRKIIYQK